jgi:hypothetical protein
LVFNQSTKFQYAAMDVRRFNITAIVADFCSLHSQLPPLVRVPHSAGSQTTFPHPAQAIIRIAVEVGCDRGATVDKIFETATLGLIDCKPGPAATSHHRAFQFEFFDNTEKNKPDQHNRTDHRKSPSPNLRIRFAALYARAKSYRYVGHPRACFR